MESRQIRKIFLEYFERKNHRIVPSAPIVVKDDPTLMFTNAGMNQFKDYFLGNKTAEIKRVADTQKCLRVSGKHNDLEEVGADGYHHTMFEMLGNWSFGDYFKEEAIDMAWELLTEHYKLDASRIYVTVFGGDATDGLQRDVEAVEYWKKWIPEERILFFGKKDNFWEMGDSGPCGPCSEIHFDLRPDEVRKASSGAELVNRGLPELIEIWNLVFIQYNRKADGSLEVLPAKHIDTGMGFERLAMVLQNKNSSYDTDIFSGMIRFISDHSGIPYTGSYKPEARSDMAMRVLADHIRAIVFTIGDGTIPSNTGSGYVIRRILRRAVRYYFSYLGISEPFLFRLIPFLVSSMGDVFPEIRSQQELIVRVNHEEELSFLRTQEGGLRKLETIQNTGGLISGQTAFELYDTFGFPFDLTCLIARERGLQVDEAGFREELSKQKERSRADAKKEYFDWNVLTEGSTVFLGYDTTEVESSRLLRWRNFQTKGQLRYLKNHSATHLLHAALRKKLGTHVAQKGSLVHEDYLRFDFSHFQKLSSEEIDQIEMLVNEKIREDIALVEKRQIPIEEARAAGAMMLFGEKYGDTVRMITFDPDYSVELCGGCHVGSTGTLGYFKIISEGAVAAGIRRVEAVTAEKAEQYIKSQLAQLNEIRLRLNNPADPVKQIESILEENKSLQKQISSLQENAASAMIDQIAREAVLVKNLKVVSKVVPFEDGKIVKNLCFNLARQLGECIVVFGFEEKGKPQLMCYISESVSSAYPAFNASQWIRKFASHIQGGGGGQAFFATAGGKNMAGLEAAIEDARAFVRDMIEQNL